MADYGADQYRWEHGLRKGHEEEDQIRVAAEQLTYREQQVENLEAEVVRLNTKIVHLQARIEDLTAQRPLAPLVDPDEGDAY